ncbi:MAG: hypothetical protein K2J68_00775 [Treponemataceae bacterium]|nr:hypothetical protein [Treponemataceae bacterium]
MKNAKLCLFILLQVFCVAFLEANEHTDKMTGAWFQMCNDKKSSVSITKIKEDVYYVMHYNPEVFYGETLTPGIFAFAEYGRTYEENKIKLTTMIGGKEQYFCLFLDGEKLYLCENFEELVYPYNETAYPYHRIENAKNENESLAKYTVKSSEERIDVLVSFIEKNLAGTSVLVNFKEEQRIWEAYKKARLETLFPDTIDSVKMLWGSDMAFEMGEEVLALNIERIKILEAYMTRECGTDGRGEFKEYVEELRCLEN